MRLERSEQNTRAGEAVEEKLRLISRVFRARYYLDEWISYRPDKVAMDINSPFMLSAKGQDRREDGRTHIDQCSAILCAVEGQQPLHQKLIVEKRQV